jgi:hypothetical protein
VVRFPSFPNSANAEMSVSYLLFELGIESNVIQQEAHGG